MKILPVNNYSYQSKAQDKQNVNFGMLRGSKETAERLCKAGFVDVKKTIANFVEIAQRAFQMDHPTENLFDETERNILNYLLDQAGVKHTVMSPEERKSFAKKLFKVEPTNRPILEVLGAEIDYAKPVSPQTEEAITKFEQITAADRAFPNEYLQKAANDIQNDLYKTSNNRFLSVV